MYFPVPKTMGSSLSSLFSKRSSSRGLLDGEEFPGGGGGQESAESRRGRIKTIISFLYKALGEAEDVGGGGPSRWEEMMMGSDVEWWFHGPPGCDYMMRMLTGQRTTSLRFEPRSIEVVGPEFVIAEGWEGEKVYWVHVWSVRDDGMITHFREYFNTWLTVTDVTTPPPPAPSTTLRIPSPDRPEKLTLWRSHPADLFKRSLPGLVLAISS